MSFTRNRIRLPLELGAPVGKVTRDTAVLIDALTNGNPRITHGRALQVEVALFNNTVLDNLSGLTSLTLELKDATSGVIDTGSAKLSKTTSDFNAGLTADQWTNDSGSPSYHAVFTFLDTEIAAVSMTSAVANEKTFGLVITGLSAFGRVSCGSGLVTLVQDGGTGAGSGVAPVASYTLTDQEILAGLNAKLDKGENPDGVGFTLFDVGGSGKGIRFYVEVPAGATEPILRMTTVERA